MARHRPRNPPHIDKYAGLSETPALATSNPVQSFQNSDYYLGRRVLNTPEVVADLLSYGDEVEVISDDTSLVLPLGLRHRFTGSQRDIVASTIETDTLIPTRLRKALMVRSGAIIRYPVKKRGTIVVSLALRHSADYTARNYHNEVYWTSHRLGEDAPRLPFRIRIAETPSTEVAEQLVSRLRYYELENTSHTLGPAVVCAAPSKSNPVE